MIMTSILKSPSYTENRTVLLFLENKHDDYSYKRCVSLQDAEELLLSNEKNGDGSYLVWTGQDGKFVLSVRCLSSQGLWEVQHSRIETSSKDDKTSVILFFVFSKYLYNILISVCSITFKTVPVLIL